MFYCLGTPEIAGLTPIQALEIIRGCKGLNIVGGDLVEVGGFYSRVSDRSQSGFFKTYSCWPGKFA